MKKVFDEIFEELTKQALHSSECLAEANVAMCGTSASRYCGEIFAYEKSKEIVQEVAEKFVESDNVLINCDILKNLANATNVCIFDKNSLELAVERLLEKYENQCNNIRYLQEQLNQNGIKTLLNNPTVSQNTDKG